MNIELLNNPNIKDIATLAQAAQAKEPILIQNPNIFNQPLYILDGQILHTEPYLIDPIEKTGNASIIDIVDFCRYVNDHKQNGTTIYAHLSKGLIACQFDDHQPTFDGTPGRKRFAATLELKLDPDWLAWQEATKGALAQDEFGSVLEELSHTVIEPEAAPLIDIIQKFRYTRVQKYERPVYNEQSGAVKIAYQDDIDQKGEIKLPSKIYIAVSPFRSGTPQNIEVKTYWRPKGESVMFGLQIIRPDRILEDAFRAAMEEVHIATGIDPLLCP